MGCPRQEYWSGLPFPPPVDLSHPGTQPVSPTLAVRFFTTEPPGKPPSPPPCPAFVIKGNIHRSRGLGSRCLGAGNMTANHSRGGGIAMGEQLSVFANLYIYSPTSNQVHSLSSTSVIKERKTKCFLCI